MRTSEEYRTEMLRRANHKAVELELQVLEQKYTIKTLVTLCDELRQPFNNSKRHDLYVHACDVLNDLEDREQI